MIIDWRLPTIRIRIYHAERATSGVFAGHKISRLAYRTFTSWPLVSSLITTRKIADEVRDCADFLLRRLSHRADMSPRREASRVKSDAWLMMSPRISA